MKIGTTLFHYTSHNVALEYILQNQELRFSPITKVNDPRESLEWMYSLTMEDNVDLDMDAFTDISNNLNTALRNNIKLLCMSQSIAAPTDRFVHEEFYKGYARSRMWAQYAGNHSGVCLAFDLPTLQQCLSDQIDDGSNIYSGPVNYTNSFTHEQDGFSFDYHEYLELGPEKVVQEKLTRLKDVYFFTKNEDWSSEQEFRILLRDNSEGYRTFDFQRSLKAIFLGHQFPKAYMPLMEIFSKKFEVDVLTMRWHNGYPIVIPKIFPSSTN